MVRVYVHTRRPRHVYTRARTTHGDVPPSAARMVSLLSGEYILYIYASAYTVRMVVVVRVFSEGAVCACACACVCDSVRVSYTIHSYTAHGGRYAITTCCVCVCVCAMFAVLMRASPSCGIYILCAVGTCICTWAHMLFNLSENARPKGGSMHIRTCLNDTTYTSQQCYLVCV